MSSSVAGLPSDSSTVGTKSNGAGELAGGNSNTRLSSSFTTSSHSTNGRERTPITTSRRSPERRRQTRSPTLQRRKSALPDFDTRTKQPANGTILESDSEAETVVPSPEKRRIQRKRSRSLSPSTRAKTERKVIKSGGEIRKRRIEGEEPTKRNEDERLKRLRKDDRTNGPIDNRKHSVQRIKRDYEAYSSDLSSAPSSPPPGSKLKQGTKRILYSRSQRRTSDSSSGDDEDDDERSGIESSVTGRGSLGANGRNGHGNDRATRQGNKGTQVPDMAPSRTRLRPPPLKPPPQSESSRESSPTYTHTRNNSSLNTPAAAMPKKDGDAMGRTALHKACQRGKLEDAEKAFAAKPSLLNQTDNAGYVPLHEAALNGKAKCVKYLLDCGCKVDPLGGQDKDTPLMDAVENKHVDVVELLLAAGADPRLRDVKGRNAMDLARGLDDSSDDDDDDSTRDKLIGLIQSAMEKLRGTGKKQNDERRQSVVDSASSRDQSVASPVHQTHPEIAANPIGRRRARTGKDILWLEGGKMGQAHLKKFARKGELEKVSIMLEQAITPDEETLKEAIKGGHEDVVSILLAYGAPADPLAGTKQSESRNLDGLLDHDATPMLVCIGRGNLKILQLVLNAVDARWKDKKGRTYMDIAREREGENYEEEIAMLQRAWDSSETKNGNGIKEESTQRGRTSEKQPSKRKRTSPVRKSTKSTLPSRASKSTQHANSDESSSDETTSGLPKTTHADSTDNNKNKKKKKERSPSPDEASSSPVVRKRRRLVSAGGREVSKRSQAGDSDEEMVNVDKIDKKKPVKAEQKRVKSAVVDEPSKPPALRSATATKVRVKKEEEAPEPKLSARKKIPDIPVPTREPSKRDHKPTPKVENKESTAATKARKDVETEGEVKKERKKERLAEKEDRRNADDATARKSGRVSELKGKDGTVTKREPASKTSTSSTTSSKAKESESKASLKRLNIPAPEPKMKSPAPSSTKQKENVKEVKKERAAAATAAESGESEQAEKEKAAAEQVAAEKAERKLRRREEQRRIKAEEERKAAEAAKKLQEETDRNRADTLARELASQLEKAKSDGEKSRLEQKKQRDDFLAEQDRLVQEEKRRKEAEEAKRKAEEAARIEAARIEAERIAEQARLAEEARIEALPETLQQLARKDEAEGWTFDEHRRWCTPSTISLLKGATEVTEESLKAAYGKFSEQEKWVLNTQIALALGLKDLSLKKCKSSVVII